MATKPAVPTFLSRDGKTFHVTDQAMTDWFPALHTFWDNWDTATKDASGAVVVDVPMEYMDAMLSVVWSNSFDIFCEESKMGRLIHYLAGGDNTAKRKLHDAVVRPAPPEMQLRQHSEGSRSSKGPALWEKEEEELIILGMED
eukprot:TRINITY_DN67210_c7_g3_i1.p1 TRINITY_DN67210_c7_g3~~TRINITY_DN67210_c7_g3_i1.p1  ORF type:complete len:143 (-),score=20.91 TRINITY_DN67210_c7_g3_i1:589-1017(-)